MTCIIPLHDPSPVFDDWPRSDLQHDLLVMRRDAKIKVMGRRNNMASRQQIPAGVDSVPARRSTNAGSMSLAANQKAVRNWGFVGRFSIGREKNAGV